MTQPNRSSFPLNKDDQHATETGLTKREYFASMAFQGIISAAYGKGDADISKRMAARIAALDAVILADALIDALNHEFSPTK